MRLKKGEIQAIKAVVRRFDERVSVYLLGSRVDDSKNGGDIDLLVISGKIGLKEKLKIKANLCTLIGDQKIDLVAAERLDTPFLESVFEESVRL